MKAWVLGTWHPARILRGGHALDLPARAHLRHLAEVAPAIATGELPATYRDVGEHPTQNCVISPTLPSLWAWGLPRSTLREGVALDIECAGHHLRGVGLCKLSNLDYLWLPFRSQGGQQYWTASALPRAVEWLYDLLADESIPKVMHNGQSFDVPYLEELGFVVRGYAEGGADTMLMQHLAYPEQPKGLNYCATLYARLPQWKQLSKVEEEEDK